MTYYAKPGYIEYEEWFDKNIDPMDLEHEKEKTFSNSVHEKFYKLSNQNLIICGSEISENSDNFNKCSDCFCPISEEDLKII